MFARQKKNKVEVRSTNNIHDRYVFVDKLTCFQSGASFKDGARNAPAVITQIVDAFAPTLKMYEDIWNKSALEFSN
jgi:hypothetical protein